MLPHFFMLGVTRAGIAFVFLQETTFKSRYNQNGCNGAYNCSF
jgi:hypothetical protein